MLEFVDVFYLAELEFAHFSIRYLAQTSPLICWIFILTHNCNVSLESYGFTTLPINITDTFPGLFEFIIIQSPVTRKLNKADETLTIQSIICRTWFNVFLWDKSDGCSRINFNSGLMLEAADLQSVVDADKNHRLIKSRHGGKLVFILFFLLLLYLDSFPGNPS